LSFNFDLRRYTMAVAYKEELKKRLKLEEGKPVPVPVPHLFIDDQAGGV
jgi:hypothetical protein